jgi:polyferredoxin
MKHPVRIVALLASSITCLTTMAIAQDDEFEPITPTPAAANSVGAQSPAVSPGTEMREPTLPTTSSEQNPEEHLQCHHVEIPPLTWLGLGLSALGILLFFVRKFRFRMVSLLLSVSVLGFYAGGCPCSVGASTKIVSDIVTKSSLLISATLLAIALVPTLIFGRFFCGFACPLGALQEFLAPRSKGVQTTFAREKIIRYGQPLFFLFLVTASFVTGSYYFERIDPFRAIFNVRGNTLQIVLAALLLLTALFVHRPFCRYLCPLAFLLNLAARVAPFKIVKPTDCNNCGLCQKRCPVSVIDTQNNVSNQNCIRCGDCIEACKFKKNRFSLSKGSAHDHI